MNKQQNKMQPDADSEGPFTIGEAAIQSGLPTKTVRYYDEIGLVVPSHRSENGYRQYGAQELSQLVFVRRARSFGFTVEDCRELLSLYADSGRSSREVKTITLRHLQQIEDKMEELRMLHQELSEIAGNCRGDDRPDCPILLSLADTALAGQ